MKTTRQRIERILKIEQDGITPERIADRFPKEKKIGQRDVLNHISHIKESQDVLVAPPECMECGATFDDYLNVPSQCYNCRAGEGRIRQPKFTIEES